VDKIRKGKNIISAAKSLKRYQIADATIVAFLHATSYAGRVGLFVSALRHNKNMSFNRCATLAAAEGFSPPDLIEKLIPWMEKNGLCSARRKGEDIISVTSLVLNYDGILAAIADLYDSRKPTPEDIGCITTLDIACKMPTPESDILHAVASSIGEEKAKTALSLAKNYRIVAYRSGKGLREPIVYSERLWAHSIDKAARALVPLSRIQREVILEFIDQVKKYQGYPEGLMRDFAQKNGVEPMLNLAIGVGLINRTEIQMADGTRRGFLTSPHFYTDLEAEFGEDMCDRVKIFLDSTRNGQHFGRLATGRILDPDRLLKKLINTGVIGPCTAIGTDWVTSELAGIVRVRREDPSRGLCYMELVQEDTVSQVHDIVTKGSIEAKHRDMRDSDVTEGSRFHSIEQLRPEAGELPDDLGEAERAILIKLRES